MLPVPGAVAQLGERSPVATGRRFKGVEYLGAVAQLGERLHGMQEVVGSSPIGSTSRNPAERKS